jgi:hypothetical protein
LGECPVKKRGKKQNDFLLIIALHWLHRYGRHRTHSRLIRVFPWAIAFVAEQKNKQNRCLAHHRFALASSFSSTSMASSFDDSLPPGRCLYHKTEEETKSISCSCSSRIGITVSVDFIGLIA